MLLDVCAGVDVLVGVGVGVAGTPIVIVNELAVAPEPQLQVYIPTVNPKLESVEFAHIVEPLMKEFDVYPEGTNKFLFIPFGNIPKLSPLPTKPPPGDPLVPILVGYVVTPLYTSRVSPGGVA